MRNIAPFAAIAAVGIAAFAFMANRAPELPGTKTDKNNVKSILLHNGWKITPAGTLSEKMGDTLMGGVASPDGKLLAFVNAGAQAHAVHILDTTTGKIVQHIAVPLTQSGLAWSPDGKMLYASGGVSPRIHVFAKGADGQFADAEPILLLDSVTKKDNYLSGMAISPDGKTVYIANLANDTIYAFDTITKKAKMVRRFETGARPGCLRIAPDGKLYAALWATGTIAVIDTKDLTVTSTFPVGRHPNDLLFTAKGDRLFVSCGNDDAVYAIETATGKSVEKISMTLTPNAPAGATPSALAVSPDGNTLFVANSDDNDVAVVDISKIGESRVRGFVPTAQYPTMVAVSPDGKRLFIGNGKGLGTGANGNPPNGKIDPVAGAGYPYITLLLSGVVQTVEMPDNSKLADYSKQVLANTPYTSDTLKTAANRAPKDGTNAIPARIGKNLSPIKHVIYIIKENRTYDQLFGDMKSGNGDPNLCLFGEDVSPNHHAIARQFVLLDNLYCDGEVSVDGHHWSNGAYVPDFMQRTWPAQYGGKGSPPLNTSLADTPSGRIWDVCDRAGVSYRSYYYNYNGKPEYQSADWAIARARQRDWQAADVFIKDLGDWEKSGTMPQFVIMAMSEDHTRGTTPGAFTPKAAVASNDLGIGKLVEAVSKSKFWNETAVFIIEDDAQNGPDHVDAHRTVALVASPYVKMGSVDHTMYSTSSLLRTMELILGLSPMSQYDAAATPLYNSFTNKVNTKPYTVQPARIALDSLNPPRSVAAARMEKIDFSEPDQLTTDDEDALNRALWHSIKGIDTPYPVPVRRALSLH